MLGVKMGDDNDNPFVTRKTWEVYMFSWDGGCLRLSIELLETAPSSSLDKNMFYFKKPTMDVLHPHP